MKKTSAHRKALYALAASTVVSLLFLQTIEFANAILPTGTWKINGNSFRGDLVITSVDGSGKLTGTIYGGQSIIGFWDEASQKITFMRLINPADPSTFQIFTGYLFSNCATDCLHTLAGSFEAFAGSGATAQRTVYGWFAQISIPG